MLTEEQIKNLKKGDPVVLRGEFQSVDADGAIWIKTGNCHRWYAPSCVSLPSEHGTSLSRRSSAGAETEVPTPKHDPCRLFKAGDVVEYRPKDGRANPNLLVGRRYKVSVDEPCDSGIVQVECDGLRHIDTFVAYNNLELVTPVEELEPYLMLENVPSNSIEVRDKRTNKVEATFYFGKDHAYTFEQAATRAEAERDRLNAEYRKKHGND